MKQLWYALLCCLPLFAHAADDISKVNSSVRIQAGQTTGDVGTVNGSITIEPNASAEDVHTVNGSISIDEQAKVRSVKSVNGSVRIGESARAEAVETVNGTVRIGAGSEIAADVSAVNGSISLAKNATVKGRLKNVNGKMSVEAAQVGGGIETTNGNIDIGAGSRVEGGIRVNKPKSSGWQIGKRRPPVVTIGPDAIVEGELKFEQPVELHVSDRARIGKVIGATANKFSGDRPNADGTDLQPER